MKYRHAFALAASVLLSCGLARAHAAEAFRVPRTSWGDPVIQGVYTNNTNVPFERQAELGDKAFFTEAEYAARSKRPVVWKSPRW